MCSRSRRRDGRQAALQWLLWAAWLSPQIVGAQQQAPPTAGMEGAARAAQPQQAPSGQPGYTLTVRSQVVQLDVVVRNRAGDLVHGLQAGDFTVTENDVPQKLLSVEATAAPSSQSPLQISSTAELDRREPNAPVTVLVLDELTSRFEDQYFARYSLEKYLSRQSETLDQPTTLVARTIDRTMVLSDYTTSKRAILDALNRHLVSNDWRSNNANFNDVQTGAAFASLIEIARATQGHPGHKNLVWIGRGLPTMHWQSLQPTLADDLRAEVQKCVNLLQSARITLYAIDPAGVQGVSGTTDDTGVITFDDPFDDDVSFDALTRATGGVSLHGRNDVDHLIADAVADGENFYTITYRPSSPVDDDSRKFRGIKVKLRDPSLIATTREGYYSNSTPPPVPAFANEKGKLSEGTMFDLASASTGLMVFDEIPLTLTRQEPSANQVQVSFPARAVGLTLADGKLKGDVTLIALTYDGKGKLLSKDGRVVSLHLNALDPGQVESRTIHLNTALNTQLPVARMRVVVRSNANGKLGAENFFLSDRGALHDGATGVKPR